MMQKTPEKALFDYRELEDYLLTHPSVADVAVLPDLAVGEVVKAYVVPVPGVFDPERLQAFFMKKLKSRNLTGFIEYRDSLPRSNTGKLYIRRLLEAVAEEK
ncbi:MAG TPA: hypothetical protein PL078_04385 [Bacillota bacterium]|jgi:acyl-coenzyme A synthetase/AMP-(fatty) acid ligase|nr:hypothetical protein [Peptococcaceae bacterium MAG4]NLW37710.1 long-chain fatty acid--CoA ligase [Peptococcaceae bacterium]HPU35514.1 hypothetical protein [Bacillota bacterium]HPZ43225.1 hypothetical protein [Bacillota bacterium]HQD76029.1 hypothetical protein [Bacillota bacterium]